MHQPGHRYLLGHGSEGHDLLERAGYSTLTTGDKDAGCDDGVGRLALQQPLLVYTLEQLLRGVDDAAGEGDGIAHVANVAVGVIKIPPAGVGGRGDARRGELQRLGHARVVVPERDERRELGRRVEQRIRRPSHTRRVVSLVVRERAPCPSASAATAAHVHSDRVSTILSPSTSPHPPHTRSPDPNSSTRFGFSSWQSGQIRRTFKSARKSASFTGRDGSVRSANAWRGVAIENDGGKELRIFRRS